MSLRRDRETRPSWLGLIVLAAIAFASGRWSGPTSEMAIDEARAAVPVPRAATVASSRQVGEVTRWHDVELGVTCWQIGRAVTPGAGLACLPDPALKPWLEQR